MAATVEVYNEATDRFTLVPARRALQERLGDLDASTLKTIREALIEEPYICVGNWVNCNLNVEDSAKPVGCLFAAAYMRTPQFDVDISMHDGDVRATLRQLDNYGTDAVSDAFADDGSVISQVIEAFDTWGLQKSKHIKMSWTSKTTGEFFTENVLTKGARKEVIAMIDAVIA